MTRTGGRSLSGAKARANPTAIGKLATYPANPAIATAR